MSKNPMMQTCFTCTNDFQMGAGIYAGKYIPRYDITVCNTCRNANWDGWAPGFEARLIAHLEEKGLPIPARNASGWLPRD